MKYARGTDTWEVVRAGAILTITSNGATTTRRFVDADRAAQACDRLIAEQLTSGFRAVAEGASAPPPPPPAPAEPARHAELEQTLVARGGDRESCLVYADWLQERGDPRGRLITLAFAFEDNARDEKLKAVYTSYLQRHEDQILGPLRARLGQNRLAWRHGFIDSATLERNHVREPLAPVVTALFDHPAAPLLSTLTLGDAFEIDEDFNAAIAVVAARGPRTLRDLSLGCHRDLGSLEALHRFELGSFRLSVPLVGKSDGTNGTRAPLSRTAMQSIAAAPWPLRSISLDVGLGSVEAEDIAGLLARPDLRLSRFELRSDRSDPAFTATLCRAIVASPSAATLETLNLYVELTQADYRLLSSHRAELGKLRDVYVPSRTWRPRLSSS